ncbi:hypothetical protein LDO26_15495 [Luteimonas sp. BDR2-5]|uniref:hypothetical protein n=1 Tax=Proluteimonas luteida TaxID=2878685 RepID=UPI001E32AD38|nr:hypothetical protein [Luteimonas sp. BDR2-5]MCD9029597.1 hypothetical protein [Luteimonas sp. BDR2-5]
MRHRFLLSMLLLLPAGFPVFAAAAHVAASHDAAPEPASDGLPLRSREALDAYLAHYPTALDRLPPEARAWFLAELDFGPRGLRSFSFGELAPELTKAEIAEVQRLFLDAPVAARGLDDAEAERLRSARARDPAMAVSAPVAAGYTALVAAGHDGDTVVAAYDELSGLLPTGNDLEAIGTGDLRVLFRATRRVIDHDPAPARVDAAIHIHDVLAARGWAMRNDGEMAHALLLRRGDLASAQAFAARHPALELPPLPRIEDAGVVPDGAPAVWIVDPDRPDVLTRQAIDLGAHIFIVSSPGCGFSRAASEQIPHDPVLGPLFAGHATWLASPSHLASLDALRDWNRAHPDAATAIATDTADWPLAFDSTPRFHFFRDGQLVATVDGWPAEGNREALLDAARASGFVAAAADDLAP